MSRARLLGKLAGDGDIGGFGKYDDDSWGMYDTPHPVVGGEVEVRQRHGTRKELLSTLGDEGVTVDDDGVLAGANDDEFGGRVGLSALQCSRRMTMEMPRRVVVVSLVVEQRQPLLDLKQVRWRRGSTFYQHDVATEDEALDLVPMNSSTMMMLM
jgi:hypothetical protein